MRYKIYKISNGNNTYYRIKVKVCGLYRYVRSGVRPSILLCDLVSPIELYFSPQAAINNAKAAYHRYNTKRYRTVRTWKGKV